MFDWLARKFDATTDDLLASALTKLVWLGIVAGALAFFLREKLSARFWLGYGVGSLALFVWFSRNTGGDRVFTVTDQDGTRRPGTLTEALSAGHNAVYDPHTVNRIFSDVE